MCSPLAVFWPTLEIGMIYIEEPKPMFANIATIELEEN